MTNLEVCKKIPKRCEFRDCRKKLPITKFSCKCLKYFSDKHRYPLEHDCQFDYKSRENNKSLIESMKCVENKLNKV